MTAIRCATRTYAILAPFEDDDDLDIVLDSIAPEDPLVTYVLHKGEAWAQFTFYQDPRNLVLDHVFDERVRDAIAKILKHAGEVLVFGPDGTRSIKRD